MATTALLALAGCHDTGYRAEVMPNGQGGVAVNQVKEQEASQAFAPGADSTQTNLNQNVAAQDRIDALQAQLRQRDEEIATLKRQAATPASATTPATAP